MIIQQLWSHPSTVDIISIQALIDLYTTVTGLIYIFIGEHTYYVYAFKKQEILITRKYQVLDNLIHVMWDIIYIQGIDRRRKYFPRKEFIIFLVCILMNRNLVQQHTVNNCKNSIVGHKKILWHMMCRLTLLSHNYSNVLYYNQ